jgi:N6-adenosine-specific RNA methylase IME4
MSKAEQVSKFSIIYADPPWDYKGQKQHTGKAGKDSGGAISHYSTMKLNELKKLDVQSICEKDCLLFMWSSSPHLDQAIDLMRAWGFSWATVAFAWDKQKVNPGFYTMSQVELCLVGKTGKIPQPRGLRNVRQFVSELRGEHSAKPNEVRSRIEAMFPTQAKIELFARNSSPGWSSWGNEVESNIEIKMKP